MVERLVDGLKQVWENALDARRAYLRITGASSTGCFSGKIFSKISPEEIDKQKEPVREFAIPALTCCLMVGLTGFEPATP